MSDIRDDLGDAALPEDGAFDGDETTGAMESGIAGDAAPDDGQPPIDGDVVGSAATDDASVGMLDDEDLSDT